MRVLLAEDEKALSRAIVKILEKNKYSVDAVYDGDDAFSYVENGNYDIAVLDIMMPKTDGLTVLKKLRSSGNKIPVLMLTAKSEIEDIVAGLDSGANDYLPKPFDSRELLARIRVLTRKEPKNDSKLRFGNVVLDRTTFELSAPSGSYRLTNKEYGLAEYFMSNPGAVLSTEQIMEKVWGYDSESEINVVWVYVSYLRKKLASIGADVQIKASRNAGYSIEKRCDEKFGKDKTDDDKEGNAR